MIKYLLLAGAMAIVPVQGFAAHAADTVVQTSDPAAKFGARETVSDISLSPDGTKIAYITPRPTGPGNELYTVDLATGTPKRVTATDGNPLKLSGCDWVANDRLICRIHTYQKAVGDIFVGTRLVAINADGTDAKLVSQLPGADAIGYSFDGGRVVDLLPEEDGVVLMARTFVPEGKIGSLVEKRDKGYGVERIDTRTLKKQSVEDARKDAAEYISDGRGNIRIMGVQPTSLDGFARKNLNYHYRMKGKRSWELLSTYDVTTREGFLPLAVDGEQDVAYGLQKHDGRLALFSRTLDGLQREALIYAHPRVDVDNVIRIGRNNRVVGITFATEKRHAIYFDKDVDAMAKSLSKALPNLPQTYVVDSSLDGTKMLLWAGSDIDPGNYFVFDRTAKRLNKILLDRPELDGIALATVKPITVRASDGTAIPAYLTLPPGSSGKNIPAIVMPHGGPEARDEWGFDWLAQFYANRGYAVLQPNFRGSTGYGDAWFQENGYKSWRTAVGDIVDAGRWLVSEGIANPSKLAIVGWSYGGYAALQSNVIAPELFKAVVAVAPVTDFQLKIEESRGWSDYTIERERIGSGPHIRDGSPARNVAAFKAPVLMFHGDLDRNVEIKQSRFMADALKGAGKQGELVVYPGLAHSLDDSKARADMLRRSDAFLRASMGM